MAGTTTQANVRNLSIGGESSALPAQNQHGSDAQMGDSGLLRVVTNGQMADRENAEAAAVHDARQEEWEAQQRTQGVIGYVRERFFSFRSQRETRGISLRLIESLRAFRGEYPASKLAAIQEFGGSEVYARLTALKCRGATAMLRDIYLNGETPWFIEPTPNPALPDDVAGAVNDLIALEMQKMQQTGQPVEPKAQQERQEQLTRAARKAGLGKAKSAAVESTRYLDDILVEGGFYEEFSGFLHNLTVFPYAFMKGPSVKMSTDVKWVEGQPQVKTVPKMYWTAPSPFDIYWQSGINKFADGDVIEHLRLSRSEISAMLGVPGYNDEAIREVLRLYGQGGLSNWLDYTDAERASMEMREDPHHNQSGLIDTLEYHGKIQGKLLLDYGFTDEEISDPDLDYSCIAWLVDSHMLKLQLDPNPRKRHPYYMTSFEKIPGAIVGHGISEILSDIQDVANATLRSLVNNLSIASGPQVVINDDRVSPNTDSDDIYPWKRWHVLNDPMGSAEPAVTFYQPNSNSQELLATYQQMTVIGDEISSIPRYMTGSAGGQSGAGRTASGLNMIMQNAGKVLQSVAANIDQDIFTPALQHLYDMVLLTDTTGQLRGDESVRVRGVVFANQRETERSRMLEFLSLTANPMDAQIVGMEGRAELLREVADRIGLDHMSIVPDAEQMQAQSSANPMAPPTGTPGEPQQGGRPPAEAGRPEEGLRAQAYGPSGKST